MMTVKHSWNWISISERKHSEYASVYDNSYFNFLFKRLALSHSVCYSEYFYLNLHVYCRTLYTINIFTRTFWTDFGHKELLLVLCMILCFLMPSERDLCCRVQYKTCKSSPSRTQMLDLLLISTPQFFSVFLLYWLQNYSTAIRHYAKSV